MKSLMVITAILLMASAAWAGPEIMMRGGTLPADENFVSDLDGWTNSGTGASWSWSGSGTTLSGGGGDAFMGFGGIATDATLSKTVTSGRACNMTVYSRLYTGSATAFQIRVNGGSWTALNTTGTFTQSGNIPIVAGSNLIEINLQATTVGVDVDQIEFR